MTTTRRRYDWPGVAEMARGAGGRWRLHPSLVAVTRDTLTHAQRRVPEMDATAEGCFEFAIGARTTDDLGRSVFDLYVRWVSPPPLNESETA